MTTEEIELNQPLIDAGIDVVETDLGELITKKQWGSICNSKTNPEYFDFRKLYRRPGQPAGKNNIQSTAPICPESGRNRGAT